MPQPRRTRVETRDALRPVQRRVDRVPYGDKVNADDPARPHILVQLHRMVQAGVEVDDRAVEIATRLGRHAYEEAQLHPVRTDEGLRARALQVQAASTIYYVRCGHLVKIGTTTDLGRRFKSVRPNELLAIEPGGQGVETLRHREFAELRASGEYFHPGPSLQNHITQLRARHGIPPRVVCLVPDGRDYFPQERSA
jgi:hypothetical protein